MTFISNNFMLVWFNQLISVVSAIKKICDIYDWDGKGELDLFFLGDVMYALGMNTTKKVNNDRYNTIWSAHTILDI